MKADRLSQEWMIRTLVNMGLTLNDTKIYIFLATEGPQTRKNIVNTLKFSIHQVSRSLKELRDLQMVISLTTRPVTFSGIPFEEVLDLFWNTKNGQLSLLRERREELLSIWHSITSKDPESS
jgi:HTH-type transcriptional regulator, sugar sensing transcriptional regulator